MLNRSTSHRPVSVCLSVCMSATLVYFIQTANDIIKLFSARLTHNSTFREEAPLPISKESTIRGR